LPLLLPLLLLLPLPLPLLLPLPLPLRLSLPLWLPLPFCCHPSAQREDLLFTRSPTPRFPQENSNPVEYFQPPKSDPQSTTFHHPIHHKVTIKNQTKNIHFFQNPPQKRPQNSKAPDFSGAPLFLQKAA
jgi:hypothetical protein